jgi:putative DNA primase/helicase
MSASSPITVLLSRERLALTKSFVLHEDDGHISSTSYPRATWFSAQCGSITSIHQLSEVLSHLESRRDACVIRGELMPGIDPSHLRRTKYAKQDAPASFRDVEGGLRWAMIDVDKVPLPNGLSIDDHDAVVSCAIDQLPAWLHDVTCHVQLSSSYGVTSRDKASMHLWFWFDRTVTDRELVELTRDYPVDPALYNAVQIHYTAAPVFEGMADPLQRRSWLRSGTCDVATVPIVELPTRPERAPKRAECTRPLAECNARAKRELARRNPAIEGHGGDQALFDATFLCIGFGVREEDAPDVLDAWNQRCSPPWEEDALRDKIERVYRDCRAEPGFMWEGRHFRLTDAGNAERFVHEHGHAIRYVHRRMIWRVYDGRRWVDDEGDLLVRARMRETARKLMEEADAQRKVLQSVGDGAVAYDDDDDDNKAAKALAAWARKSEGLPTIKAAIELAKSIDGVATAASDYDADPWLLNCPNGTVDMKTGQLRAHNPEDMITKMTRVPYVRGARHALWDKYLHDATNGDVEFAHYLAKWGGYAATGDVREKAFAFLYGPTDTAKTTFVNALREALGSYAAAVDASTWLVQTFTGGNRGDLVGLAGVRLVSTVEFRKGAKFDESVLKRVTGGDPVTASDKYEKSIQFTPICKILLAANDAPQFNGCDQAVVNRCHRIPFNHKITKAQRDPTINDRLQHDAECGQAVLAWMVEGCLAWQREGLAQPAVVQESTEAYRLENDPVAMFLREACELDEEARLPRGQLRDAFDDWVRTQRVDDPKLSEREFVKRIREAGTTERKGTKDRTWGITLRALNLHDLSREDKLRIGMRQGFGAPN